MAGRKVILTREVASRSGGVGDTHKVLIMAYCPCKAWRFRGTCAHVDTVLSELRSAP